MLCCKGFVVEAKLFTNPATLGEGVLMASHGFERNAVGRTITEV